MDREMLLNEIIPIFREVLEDDAVTITENDSSETIDGWDSLAHILIISELESHFSIKIPMSKVQEMKKVSKMIDVIVELT